MTCLVQGIYTHIHHPLGTGNSYTYTWPVWYRKFIHNRSCICVDIACTKQVMYMCIDCLYQTGHVYVCMNCMYQTGHVYVYKLHLPFIHIYITCLVQAIYTHWLDLLGTGNLYTYTSPVWYRQFIHIYLTCVYVYKLHLPNRWCICV
jgi:hypothetical protein